MSEEVLIVGAGPVGLAAAVELTRRGLPVRIVEKDRERVPYSKALAVNPRTMELLQASGVTERLLGEGLKIECFHVFDEKGDLAKVSFADLDHPFRFMLGLPQARTEAILEQRLSELGVTVERGVEVVGLTQEHSGARLSARRDGEAVGLEAATVLAADGAHSMLRKALDIGFPGTHAPQTFNMIDAKMAWDLPHDEVFVRMHEHRPLACIPLPEADCYRLIAIEQQPEEHLPPGAAIERLDWQSSFQVHYRLAERFTQGSVHLAGDAAHIHSPVGGRGMNLGIEDACFFAMLAAKGALAGYGEARRPVAEGVLNLTENFTSLVASQKYLTQWLRDKVGFRLLSIPAMRKRAMHGVTGLDHPNPVTG